MIIIKNDSINNIKENILLSKFDNFSDGVLVDIRLSKDKQIVLSKNDYLYGSYYINKMDYQDIKKIKFMSKVNKYYIPLLSEILDKYPKEYLVINIQNNYDNNEEIVLILNDLLAEYPHIKFIITTKNDNVYSYSKNILSHPIYFLDNKRLVFIDFKKVDGKMTMFKNNNLINDDSIIFTNDTKLAKNYYNY